MIKYDHLMIRFGELSTKGKNKSSFVHLLFSNVKHALKDFENLTFIEKYDHIYVGLNGEEYQKIVERLQDVSGIQGISLVFKCENDIEVIKSSSLELIKQEEGKTFKVKCKRGNKKFPIISDDVIRQVAPVILKNTDLKVDVHNPNILLNIDIREEATYIFCKTFDGAGGHPLGIAGKSMHMLSGGIDSPVAAYLLMKRGVKIECIHFASPPYTQEGVIFKLEDLLKKLNRYQPTIRLNIVPFTKIQEAIYDHVPESYCITMMRRMMFRLASKLSLRRNCPVISSGESVGQVASQTLDSMHVINEVTNIPVIRPCAALDKLEIISIAKKIDTFDISIRPYEDCCTIFTPKAPKTSPKLDEVRKFEEEFDYEPLLNEAIKNIEVRQIGENKK